MIRLTLLLLTLCCSCCFGQIQTPFPDSNALWAQIRVIPDDPFDPWDEEVSYNYQYFPYLSDSIDGKEYTRLYMGEGEDILFMESEGGDISWYDFDLIGHYRIDSNRVYFRSDHTSVPWQYELEDDYGFQTNEIMLYDYNLQIGDTFQLTHSGQIRLESFDSVEIGGDYYRTFHFQFLNYIEMSEEEYYWIEGVGSTLGFFSYFRFFEDFLCFNWFAEYEYNYNYLPTVVFCNHNGLKESTSNFQISPNPTSSAITINNTTGYSINGFITNMNGELIENIEIQSSTCQLDLSHLNTGLYIINLGFEKHRIMKL